MVIVVLLFDDAIAHDPDIKAFLSRNVFTLIILAGITFAELLFVLSEVMPVNKVIHCQKGLVAQCTQAVSCKNDQKEAKLFAELADACAKSDKLTAAVQSLIDESLRRIAAPPAIVDTTDVSGISEGPELKVSPNMSKPAAYVELKSQQISVKS